MKAGGNGIESENGVIMAVIGGKRNGYESGVKRRRNERR
jgi:hypothetical protein